MHSMTQQFASDNYSGACPEVLEALVQANAGYAKAYGDDEYTKAAADHIRALFESSCEVFFVFNGTAANSLALASLCQSYHSVVCHELSHIETDECGAPQFFSNGMKLLLSHETNGKITPESITRLVTKRDDLHYPKPKVISLTQPTETGQVYTLEELRDIKAVAKTYGLKLHIDGARLANALAELDISPGVFIRESGADVLSFGGTKNGMFLGEAVVFFDTALAIDFEYRCKQAGQLASKMRYISAQWLGILKNNVWLKNAKHANAMAAYFSTEVAKIEGVKHLFPCKANAVFLELSPTKIKQLRQSGWVFYTFIGVGGVRFVFSWDATKARVDELLEAIRGT
jgi:threonine aldolase